MNYLHMPVQFYSNAKDNKGKVITIMEVINMIGDEKIKAKIDDIRERVKFVDGAGKEKDNPGYLEYLKQHEEIIQRLKKELPAVTWSGTFTQRKTEGLKEYTGLLTIDIDKIPSHDELQALKERLKNDPRTFLVFVSPGGKGLKLLVKVEGGAKKHKANFELAEKYYKDAYGIEIDKSGKDICRLCFLSADSNFYCNPQSEVLVNAENADPVKKETATDTPSTEERKAIALTATQTRDLKNAADTFDYLHKFTANKYTYTEGQRNLYIFTFSSNACRKGIYQDECIDHMLSFATDIPNQEIISTVIKAYRYNSNQFGKYKFQPHGKRSTANAANSNTNVGNGHLHPVQPGSGNNNTDQSYTKFWREVTAEKGKGDSKKTVVTRLELYRVAFITYLQEQGFFIVETDKDGFQICQNTNGIMRTVDPRKIKNHVYKWCKENELLQVEEMLRKGQKNYFAYTELESLRVQRPEFLEDTPTEAFFFFKNCYVRITAEGITTHNIAEVNKAIWEGQIIKREFTPIKDITGYYNNPDFLFVPVKSEIERFIMQVSTNPKRWGEVGEETIKKRYEAVCTSIGYILHGYKTKIGKAIVAVDHKMPGDKSEQNGGTGKSIIGESFKYLKPVTIIDGRDFDEKYAFRFEAIDLSTKIVIMQDCKYSLDFGTFFVPITSDFRFNRRHTGYINMPYETSPKWWFDTNFVFKGEGPSFRRRQHIIEFDDYYTENHTPLDEFGHFLFGDWDDAEWNRFYNFYFFCVQLFLQKGLVTYSGSNYDSRKLMVESNQDFIDWMDATETVEGQTGTYTKYKIQRNVQVPKKELLKQWNEEARSLNMNTITSHIFIRWVKKYCQSNGLKFDNPKRNGVEYYILKDANYEAEKIKQQTLSLFDTKKDDDEKTSNQVK